MDKEIFNFRFYANISDKKRDKGLKTPSDVLRFNDVCYYKKLLLDVYKPKDNINDYLPVIISVHGGGYCYGKKEIYQYYCMNLAQRGFILINFNYHLLPRYKFPTPVIETNEVCKWMVEHKDEYKFDLNNVFMVGDSAGAQILSQFATVYANKEYAKIMNIECPKFKLKGIGLNCGLYEISDKNDKVNGLKELYFGKDRSDERMNVLKYIDSNYPATYILSSGGDFLLEHFAPMKKLLLDRGVDCEGKVYGDKNLGHIFHVNMRNEIGKVANDDEINFFKKHIGKGD